MSETLRDLQLAPNLPARRRKGRVFVALALAATMIGILVLLILLVDVINKAWGWLDWQFLTSFPSRFPEKAGILSSLVGSIYLVLLTALFSFPVGVAAAIYLEEYAPKNWVTNLIQTNISNLAGVPSIVYGLLGLGIFVRALALGRSLLAGSLTMSLLILPTIIIVAREAIRAVPASLRHAALAVGSTRWQTVWHHILPQAFPGILTGTILALSRVLWRDRAAHHHRRADLHRLPARKRAGSVHRPAHPDLQLDLAPARRFSSHRRGGDRAFIGRSALCQCSGCPAA